MAATQHSPHRCWLTVDYDRDGAGVSRQGVCGGGRGDGVAGGGGRGGPAERGRPGASGWTWTQDQEVSDTYIQVIVMCNGSRSLEEVVRVLLFFVFMFAKFHL